MKCIYVGKEEVKLPLFAYDTILYTKRYKQSTKKLLELVNKFSKFEVHNINIKSVVFLYFSNEQFGE